MQSSSVQWWELTIPVTRGLNKNLRYYGYSQRHFLPLKDENSVRHRAYRNLHVTCGRLRVACSQMTAGVSQTLRRNRKSRKCHADWRQGCKMILSSLGQL